MMNNHGIMNDKPVNENDRPVIENIEPINGIAEGAISAERVEPFAVKTLDMPKVRAMTRRQRKQMELAGFNVLDVENEERAGQTLKMFDWILDNVYADVDLDDYPNGDCMRLATDTFLLAMGRLTDEAKNS